MHQILLDTHVALWSLDGTLGEDASEAITRASTMRHLLLSPISAWEIGLLASKRRIELDEPVENYVRAMFSDEGVRVAALTPAIAVAAGALENIHGDPADRILIATAAHYDAQLMTRDKRILEYAKATKHIRVIAC